ncbi:hypothetical protein [Streptomyces sp. AHA2]|uniref:hypothetical protein n=1 Tax=Streptomyces sp. AHA2 TaxID=3064526 RepID=UPI002FE2E9FB
MSLPADAPEPCLRLVGDVLAVGEAYGLVLAGGYGMVAHGLAGRGGVEVDVATEHPAGMDDIAGAVRTGLVARGWLVRTLESDPLSASFLVTDAVTGQECGVSLRKEVLWRPPVPTGLGPALSLEDLAGIRVRDLADHGLARDLVHVHAVSSRWSHPELEELARRHAPDTFDPTDLQARLTGTDWLDDRAFVAEGVEPEDVAGLRRWAQEWADDIAERLIEGQVPEDSAEQDGSLADSAVGDGSVRDGVAEDRLPDGGSADRS